MILVTLNIPNRHRSVFVTRFTEDLPAPTRSLRLMLNEFYHLRSAATHHVMILQQISGGRMHSQLILMIHAFYHLRNNPSCYDFAADLRWQNAWSVNINNPCMLPLRSAATYHVMILQQISGGGIHGQFYSTIHSVEIFLVEKLIF